METLINWLLVGLVAAAIACIASVLIAVPLMVLWNWLMPLIFGLKTLSFFEALGLVLLCQILFKNSINSSSKD